MKKLWPLLVVCFLAACADDPCQRKTGRSCGALEKEKLRVVFYAPDGTREEIGDVVGLKACAGAAREYAASKQLTGFAGWTWSCCVGPPNNPCQTEFR